MNAAASSKWDALKRRWDRAFGLSLLLSLVLHIVLVLLFRETVMAPDVPTSAAGEDAGDPAAARGGGMELIAYTEVRTPEVPEAEVPVPVPVPDAAQQQVEQREPARASSQPLGQAHSPGEGRGSETGPGTDSGTGRGDGGTGESGTSRVVAPSPRGLILPPSDRPASVRGRQVTVYVFVSERGRVVSDSTRLAPSTGDTRFDARLRREASEWVFNPARRDGQPVAEWFQYQIVL